MLGRVLAMKLLCISGALHERSGNRRLLEELRDLHTPGVAITIDSLLGRLPLFNSDLEAEHELPVVREWRQQLRDCDAIVFACPEYAFSLSGALKNGIDWVVGSGEMEAALVAITALVAGPSRGAKGVEALERPLGALSCEICWNRPITKQEDPSAALSELVVAMQAAHAKRLSLSE